VTDPADMCATILDSVHGQLSIDDVWTVHDANGFTWWPGDGVRQHVRAEGPVDVDGCATWWLSIETPVWRVGDAAGIVALECAIEALRVRAFGAGVVTDMEDGSVALVSRSYLMPETVPERCFPLAGLGALQARLALDAWADAEARVGDHARAWRDARPHPIGGERIGSDEILTLPDTAMPAIARRHGHAGLLDMWSRTGDALATALGGEPHSQHDTLLMFGADLGRLQASVLCGLMRGGLAGPSVAVTIILDGRYGPQDGRALCEALQRLALEPPSLAWTLGSWVLRDRVDGTDGLMPVYGAFLPIGLFEPAYGGVLGHAIGCYLGDLRRSLQASPDLRR